VEERLRAPERYSGGWPARRVAQTLEEVDRFMPMTEPKLFGVSPDIAHLNLAGCDGVGALSRVLKSANYRRWICVDLDTARRDRRADFKQCGAYGVNKLEPVYA
jgi:hypothetical protein